MYMLTLKDRTTDGAYAIADKNGDKVLLMFEETDDAERYAMYLEIMKNMLMKWLLSKLMMNLL